MKRETSLYLDAIRFLAAMAVFFSHIKRDHISGGAPWLLTLGQYGQEGVAVFFVISGVVIAYVAQHKETDFRTYLVARLGRLWSVALPALLLTVVLDVLGRAIAPAMYDEPDLRAWDWSLASLWNAVGPALFLNEVSFASAAPGTNGPFWSLCYEFWYYILFGAAYFLRGAWRLALILAAVAVAGAGIMALFPVWLLGVALYLRLGLGHAPRAGALAWSASGLAIAALALLKYKLATALVAAAPGMGWTVEGIASGVSHYAVGMACALNVLAFDAMPRTLAAAVTRFEKPIRFLAARSFSLYLYQAPLIFFFGAATYGMRDNLLRIAIVTAASLASVLVLAELTEKRKRLFTALAGRLVPRLRPRGAAAPAGGVAL